MTISGTTIAAGTVVDFATGSTYRSAARGLAATSGTQGLAVLVGRAVVVLERVETELPEL